MLIKLSIYELQLTKETLGFISTEIQRAYE